MIQAERLEVKLHRCNFFSSCFLAENIGIYGVEVVALNDQARAFYLKYGFVELLDDRLHLFLPLETIKEVGI